ncbi:adenine phosphoribosyltransferase [Nocardioides ultimimeridianus]
MPESSTDVLQRLVRDVPDFPQPGVMFKDIMPLLADPEGFRTVVATLADAGRDHTGAVVVDKVIGMESRGFILGAPVALALGVGFVPARKPGKLPGETHAVSYALEYGEATLEIQGDALRPGERILVIDDVLATGGTARATCELIERAGAVVHRLAFLMELSFLPGRDATAGHDVTALLTV